MASRIYLDTHVVVWLNDGEIDKLSTRSKELIDSCGELILSPFVRLELRYLFEIERLRESPDAVVDYLSSNIGAQLCGKPLNDIITEALAFSWTRDPFDRLITASASLDNETLITKDTTILENYPYAVF